MDFKPNQQMPHPGNRFGHSISVISSMRSILFGGAVADPNYRITNDVFSFNSKTGKWTQVTAKSAKYSPSARAAHGATAIDNLQVVVFGGAQAQGRVVDNDLYLLKLMEDETQCRWVKVPVEEPRPSSRYGHTMAYMKPYIFLIGGSIGRGEGSTDCRQRADQRSVGTEHRGQRVQVGQGRLQKRTCAFSESVSQFFYSQDQQDKPNHFVVWWEGVR